MRLSELLDKCNLNTFVAIDLETTGLNPKEESIIEVSAVKFINGKKDSIFSQLTNPGKPISPFIEDLTGINNDMVKGKSIFKDILNELLDFVGDFPIIGHNVNFDINFIKEHSKDGLDLRVSNKICDTYLLSKIALFSNEEHSLESISEFYGFSIEGSHRATNDAINSGKILIRLLEDLVEFESEILSRINSIFSQRDIENSIIFKGLSSLDGNSNVKRSKKIKSVNPIFYFKNKSNKKMLSIDNVIGPKGLLYVDTNYEYRELQHKMVTHIEEGIGEGNVSIIEAGTGLGKTYAYLIPFLYESKKKGLPLIVSTYTKPLQDQLFDKDLKNIINLLGIDVKGVLIKGRDNYICPHRLQLLESNSKELIRNSECHDLSALIAWSYYTKSGDVEECSSFSRTRNSKIWNLVKSEFRFCQLKCSNSEECYHSNISNNIKDADVIIVNHALLLSNVLDEKKLLPREHLFVIDEAHDLFKAAKNSLTFVYEKKSFNEILSDISVLINKSIKKEGEGNLINIIDEIDMIKKEVTLFFKSYLDSSSSNNEKQNYPSTLIFNNVETEFQDCDPTLLELMHRFNTLGDKFLHFDENIDNYSDLDKNGAIELMRTFIEKTELLTEQVKSNEYISWMKIFKKTDSCSMHYLQKDIGKILYQKYFNQGNIGLLCSATLTVNNSFEYFCSEIGLDRLEYEQDIKKIMLPTPFILEEQLKFFSFKSELNINSDKYIENIAEQIFEISSHYNKRMLVLCTSYKQASQIKNILKPKFAKINRKIFVHEKGRSKNSLVRAYKNTESSVLVGTMAFWEGVDFPGDELSILMMIRIPFDNPNDPYVKFVSDQLSSIGKDSFNTYQVPNACLKMKQGFGRLIRTEYDSGFFIITDPRIYNSSYGHKIINSFPVETVPYTHFSTILNNEKIL